MAKTASTKPEAVAEDKPKRTMLTPEQRVAKLEAELAAARERAEKKANKAVNEAKDKRAKLVEKRNALDNQIAQLTATIGDGGPAENTDES